MIKDTAIVATANLSRPLIVGLATILLSRVYSPADFGLLTGALAISLVVSTIVDLGLGESLIRSTARGHIQESREIIGLLSILGLIFSLGFGGLAITFQIKSYLILALIGDFSFRIMDCHICYYRGQKRFLLPALIQILIAIGIACNYAFAALTRQPIENILTVYAGIGVLSFVTSAILLAKHTTIRMKFSSIIAHLQSSLLFLGSNLLSSLYNRSNLSLLTIMREPAEVGLFSLVSRIYNFALVIPQSIMMAASPIFYAYAQNQSSLQAIVRKISKMLFVFGMTCAILLVSRSTEVLALIGSTAYLPAAPFLAVMSFGVLLKSASLVFSTYLKSIDRVASMLRIQTIVSVSSILIMGILIHLYGGMGASVATLVTEGLLMLGYGTIALTHSFPYASPPLTSFILGISAISLFSLTIGQTLNIYLSALLLIVLLGSLVVTKSEISLIWSTTNQRIRRKLQ
jgi:O-antigen/teichoic acid export membrane protein